jgi:hypothetical protein
MEREDASGTANVVWYAVKRCAKQAGINNLDPTIFVAVVPASAIAMEANSNGFSVCLATPQCKRWFTRASIYAGPRALPQCFRQLCIIKNLWQPGEPCKLFKTLNIYGLKGHCSTN